MKDQIDVKDVVVAMVTEYDDTDTNRLGIRLIVNMHDREKVVAGFLSLMRMMDKNEDLREMFRDANAVNQMIRDGMVESSYIGENIIVGKKTDRKDMS